MLLSRKIGVLIITLLACTSIALATNGSEENATKKEQNQCTQEWLTNNASNYQKAIDSLGVFNAEKEVLQAQLLTCKNRQCVDIKKKLQQVNRDFDQTVLWMKNYERCSNRFTVLEKPIITGPTSVMVGESNLYSVVAKSSNTTLPYYITYTFDWGDGSPKESKAIESGYSVYHIYTKAGTYTITATAKDSTGRKTKSTSVVKVENIDDILCILDPNFCLNPYWQVNDGVCQEDGFKTQTVACYEKGVPVDENKCNPNTKPVAQRLSCPRMSNFAIISPNGGEKWITGNTQNITWSFDGFAGNQEIELYLHFPTGSTCFLGLSLANAKSFSFLLTKNFQCPNIPQTIIDGSYKIIIFPRSVDSSLDTSDNFFTISAN